MDRLLSPCDGCGSFEEDCADTCDKWIEYIFPALRLLDTYQDTELTPSEITDLKIFYTERSNELRLAKDELARLHEDEAKTCDWRQEDEDCGLWECSACGAEWVFTEDGPIENEMRFCPHCGVKIATTTTRHYDYETGEYVNETASLQEATHNGEG